MAKAEAKETNEKVVVKYNGPSGWDLSLSGRGKVAIKPGEEYAFDPREPTELRALLGIIKEVNRPRTNYRIALKPPVEGQQEQEKIYRFELLSGTDALPKVLQKHSYTASNLYTDEEKKAILDLCPTFFDKSTMRGRMVTVM